MIATAVPFYTARLQSTLSRSISSTGAGAAKCEASDNQVATKTRRRLNLTLKEKLQTRSVLQSAYLKKKKKMRCPSLLMFL